MAKQGKSVGRSIFYIKAEALADIVRYATHFFGQSRPVFMFNKGKSSRLFILSETIDDIVIGLYVDVPTPTSHSIKYTYPTYDHMESAEFVSKVMQEPDTHYINVVEFDASAFNAAKKLNKKKLAFLKMVRVEDFVKSLINKSIRNEHLEHAYTFKYKNKFIIGTFELFPKLSDDVRIFYYCVLDEKPSASFLRYDYSYDKFEFTDDFGGHAYMYAKVTSLAEPFPNFSMGKK